MPMGPIHSFSGSVSEWVAVGLLAVLVLFTIGLYWGAGKAFKG